MDSHALLTAIGQGDKEALAQFQTLHTPLVRYIISPILDNEADREECLSEVFLKIWASADRYDPGRGALSTWLATLARNTALNHLRGNAKHQSEALSDAIPDPVGTPEQAVLKMELQLAVRQAVARLSAKDRALFDRKYYYYQSTAQIAAELGMTVRGVEGRLYRIRKQLQKELGGVWHE